MEDISTGYEVMLLVNIFKTKFPSLLIRLIMTTDSKYKTSYEDFFCNVYLKIFLIQNSTPCI